MTEPDSWNRCPGMQNHADLPSRGLSATKLLGSTLWWNGSLFIAQVLVEPPSLDHNLSKEAQAEVAKTPTNFTQILTNQETARGDGVHQLIDCTMYSCLGKLLRVTVYVLCFVCTLRRGYTNDMDDIFLKAEEIAKAEILWIQGIQELAFHNKL